MRALLLVPIALGSICEEPVPQAIEIPVEVHGSYGRDGSDLALGTLGLEVDAGSIRFSEMTITVTDGKLVGDTFQIGRAEVRWKKDDAEKLPKECKGTLARQGTRLLVSLFKKDSDEPCESVLAGDWSAWESTTEFPETMRGLFGSADPYVADVPVVVGSSEVKLPHGDAPLVLKEAVRFQDRDEELFVRKAELGGEACEGSFRVKDDVLSAALGDCPPLQGTRWRMEQSAVPRGTMSNGRATVTFAGDTVKIRSEGGTECTQKILRTAQRPTTDAGRDRIPVPSGAVLVLEDAEAKGTDACAESLKNLVQSQCRARLGVPCADEEISAIVSSTEVLCPTHLVVGDAGTKGRKMALLPDDVTTLACFDMTGDFLEK